MVVNFVVNYRCKQKLLKETETEKQYTFCHIFVIGDISIRRPAPCPPLVTPMGPLSYGKSSPDYSIACIKRLDEDLR